MDLCFNKIVRTGCGGFLLTLTGAISGAKVGPISFDGQTFLQAIADTKTAMFRGIPIARSEQRQLDEADGISFVSRRRQRRAAWRRQYDQVDQRT